jgi:hypothetical protein
MTSLFSVIEVDRESAYDLEQLGTKRKFWFRRSEDDSVRWLFKAEERETGEDWAEKIACELCERLGIPHAHYELAVESESRTPGVVCPNIAPPPLTLVLGNQLLFERDPAYPARDDRKYGVRQHSVDVVLEVIDKLHSPPTQYCQKLPEQIDSAVGVFIGYLMLDALIANQDRHHQNWGALRSDVSMLAPSFDHGAALARNEPEAKRKRRLHGPDPGYSIESFAGKARSSLYGPENTNRPLNTLAAFLRFADASPVSAKAWLTRLRSLTRDDIESIVGCIPESRMSTLTREFTVKLLLVNQRRLLGE